MSEQTVTISLRGLRDFKIGTMTIDGEEHRYAIFLSFAHAPDLKDQMPTLGDLWGACIETRAIPTPTGAS